MSGNIADARIRELERLKELKDDIKEKIPKGAGRLVSNSGFDELGNPRLGVLVFEGRERCSAQGII